jgi:hypothetical protein
VSDRRTILGSLLALLSAPVVFGRETAARLLAPGAKPAAPPAPMKLNPPAHSVKRRG